MASQSVRKSGPVEEHFPRGGWEFAVPWWVRAWRGIGSLPDQRRLFVGRRAEARAEAWVDEMFRTGSA